jgi:multimeric flavodoxin WrbA
MVEVVAVNGSPDKAKGNTARLLDNLLEGMRSAGANTKVLYASEVKPRPCTGEMNCWYRTPGQCHVRDGMQEAYPVLKEADILVLATPVYIPLPGDMQNFINRMCPLFRPRLEFSQGRTRAKARDGVKLKGVVLVSTGAWWELGNLDILVRIAEEMAMKMGAKYLGGVLRPHAFVMEGDQVKAQEVYQATRQAGRRLIMDGEFPKELLERISKPLVSEEELRARWNSLEEKVESQKEEK